MAVVGKDPTERPAASLEAATDWVRARAAAPASSGLLIRIAEIALVALLAWLLARIVLTLLTPTPSPQLAVTPAPAGAATGAEAQPVNPFRSAAAEAPAITDPAPTENLAETTLDLVLYGTWTSGDAEGKAGTAFIGAGDDRQRRYTVGDEIVSGATLQRVYRDQVVIARGPVSETLKIKNWDSVSQPVRPQRPAPAARTTDDESINVFTELVRVSAKTSLDEGMRFVLKPAGNPAAFEALGLQDGDIVVSIENIDIASTPAKIGGAIQQLQGKTQVSLVVNRDGVDTPVTVSLPDAAALLSNEEAYYEN